MRVQTKDEDQSKHMTIGDETAPEDEVVAEIHDKLRLFFSDNAAKIVNTIGYYIRRSGLVQNKDHERELIEELLSETFITAMENAHQLANPDRPSTWIYRIAANILKQRQRGHKTEDKHITLVLDRRSAGDSEIPSEEELFDLLSSIDFQESYEQRDAIERILRLLSSEDQNTLRVAMSSNMRPKLMAERLGIKQTTARSRLYRALTRAREVVSQQKINVPR